MFVPYSLFFRFLVCGLYNLTEFESVKLMFGHRMCVVAGNRFVNPKSLLNQMI